MDYDPTMADDTYTVERSVTPARIYDQIANFHDWTNWSPWETVDTELKRTSGAESGIGAVYGWRATARPVKPWKAHNDTWFTIQPEGSVSRTRRRA